MLVHNPEFPAGQIRWHLGYICFVVTRLYGQTLNSLVAVSSNLCSPLMHNYFSDFFDTFLFKLYKIDPRREAEDQDGILCDTIIFYLNSQ